MSGTTQPGLQTVSSPLFRLAEKRDSISPFLNRASLLDASRRMSSPWSPFKLSSANHLSPPPHAPPHPTQMIDKIWSDWQTTHPSNFHQFTGGSVMALRDLAYYDRYPTGGPPMLSVSINSFPRHSYLVNYRDTHHCISETFF